MKARRTKLQVAYKGKDISRDINEYLLDFSYTDNDAEAEDVQIRLENRERLWMKEWFPNRGDSIIPKIVIVDEEGKEDSLPCGEFEVDEIGAQGAINQVNIKGISSMVSGAMKDTKRSKAWEKAKYQTIVSEIATKNGMTTIFNIEKNKVYDKIDQNNESDIEFIKKITEEQGYELKVEDKKIIITEEAYYKKLKPDFIIDYENENKNFLLLDWSFTQSSLTSYTAAELQYKDPKSGKLYSARVDNDKEQVTGKVLRLNTAVKSNEEAKEKCQEALDGENKNTNVASFTLAPFFIVSAKNVVEVKGWGKFDGKYLIQSVSHTVGQGGYSISLECSKLL